MRNNQKLKFIWEKKDYSFFPPKICFTKRSKSNRDTNENERRKNGVKTQPQYAMILAFVFNIKHIAKSQSWPLC